MKPNTFQKYILKISSKRLKYNNWNLNVSLHEARRNAELIPLSDSTLMRFIDEINAGSVNDAIINKEIAENEVKNLKKSLKFIKKQPKSSENSRKIIKTYSKIDEYCYYPEIMCLVCGGKNDLHTASNGFKINGYEYKRLVGTPGGIKKSTIIFVSTHTRDGIPLYDELVKRINNGRNMDKELVTAKLEAYKALVCSSSVPVSHPRGVLVVDDCITKFKDSFIKLDDSNGGEPELTIVEFGDVELNASDGFGLASPELSIRWSEDVGEKFIVAGFCVRNSFCKGMVFTFDFHKFAREVACTDRVVDAWGNVHNINDIDLVLTTSMLKLWDSYRDISDYLDSCNKNSYTFSVTKITPDVLEDERYLNYQFIQSYHLTDEQIDELIAPTVNELLDVLGGDTNRTLLFLRGVGMTEENADVCDNDFVKALMIDERMMDDPYVRSKVYHLIKKRIDMAKIGRLKVNGNFSILSGDPYALCQSIWGLPVTGLLKANCIYSKYWSDKCVDRVACFRAPMSCHNNIRLANVVSDDKMSEWYKYMNTITILNSWDLFSQALNGADFDGDILFSTDNCILVENYRPSLPIVCVQRAAKKIIPTEQDFIQSNINGFGDEIGSVTNRITAMIDVRAGYPESSEEYKILDYRIMCGQLYQQAAIDRIKGIITNPMPLSWYSAAAAKNTKYEHIVADKKPYFMIYIYPDEKRKYTNYIKNAEKKSIIATGVSLEKNIERMISDDLLDEERSFVEWYEKKCPIQTGNSVVNRIAWKIENIFKDFRESKTNNFDCSILKSGVGYDKKTFNKVAKIYRNYIELYKEFRAMIFNHRMDTFSFAIEKSTMNKNFVNECFRLCSNEDILCDILVDCCYEKSSSKHFVWEMCSETMIKNLLRLSGNRIKYVERDEFGEIEYCSMRFSSRYKQLPEINTQDELYDECTRCDDFSDDVVFNKYTREYD